MRTALTVSRGLCRSCAQRQEAAAWSQVRRSSSQSARPSLESPSSSRRRHGTKNWLSSSARSLAPPPSSAAAAAKTRPTSEAPAAPSPGSTTHYDLFPSTLPDGPPPTGHFPIDVRALRREFLQLQARAHPDRHPPERKAQAEALSAHINDAYKTLSNPLLRAQYLLSLQGVNIAEDETAKVEDPELLMTVLEAREEIEAATEEAQLESVRAENDVRIRESEDVLEVAFREHDIESAKHEAVKLRYWVNIKESLDNWEKGKPVVLEH